jgi:hypothetical protein
MYINFIPLAYFTPDALLPATSIVATIAGVAMILGRTSLRFMLRCCRRSMGARSRIGEMSGPHFRLREEAPSRVVRR